MSVNVEEIENQLLTVEQALQLTSEATDRVALESLRTNLLELLELTKQTASLESSNDENNDDNEMQRFMNEIAQLDTERTEQAEGNSDDMDDVELQVQELRAKLEEMVGQKCSAPHQHAWGAVTYHNAIVCGVEDSIEDSCDMRLRVLFTNPTHREMLPCSFYLEGDCRFDEEQCHFSHGELVSIEDLREYTAPDFERLARNCVVLAKLQDRIWHRGRVLCANFVEKLCRVRLDSKEHKERERDFPFEDLFPIFHDEDLSSGSSSDSSDSDSEQLDDFEEAKRAQLVEQSLFTFQPSQPLGEWEKHTRGIGSKLMAKMGYIHGTGLGSDGRGIVIPVSAQILPQGRSLDHCMELREAANGDKDLFSVERKLKREQKKQAAINAKAYERESQRIDVFSFLNDSVLSNQQPNGTAIKTIKEKHTLQNQTTKNLNVESVRIADDIRRKEREISKVQESLRRNVSGTEVYKRLHTQLNAKTQELHALKGQENCLSKEQASRRTKDKLSVF